MPDAIDRGSPILRAVKAESPLLSSSCDLFRVREIWIVDENYRQARQLVELSPIWLDHD
jgi:hypothetical protein